jgi:hypothetical protein
MSSTLLSGLAEPDYGRKISRQAAADPEVARLDCTRFAGRLNQRAETQDEAGRRGNRARLSRH